MHYVTLLRRLVDQQQFALLKDNATAYWEETADVAALPLLALACAHLGERKAAETALARLQEADAELGPDSDPDARVDLAAAHIMTGRLPQATVALEAVLAENPGHALALARLAFCRMQAGKADAARDLYQRAIALAPHRLPVWIALARLQLEAGDRAAAQIAQVAIDAASAQLQAQQADLPEPAQLIFTTQLRLLQLEQWIAVDEIGCAEAWHTERRETLNEADWAELVVGYATLLAGHDQHGAAEDALCNALEQYPDNLELISQRAELAQIQGRTMQAIQILRRAIRVAEKQEQPAVELWARLSGACLHSLDAQARKAAEQAMTLAAALSASDALPEARIRSLRLRAKLALAQVESQEQHYATAEALFREVLAEAPYSVTALQGLGQQQMQRGRLYEAVVLFERVKAIDPAKGYAALINARQFPEDDATLAHMEKLARQPSLEGSARSSILFQLAAAWEKRKDDDKSFEMAQAANAASRKLLRYDAKAHRQSCARIRHAFGKALYEHRADCGYRGEDESLPVFVLGMPRSGTTLVEQIIAGHSQIFGAGELGVIPQRIHGLNRWERHVGSGRSYPDCIDDLNPYATAGIARGILDELKALAAQDKPGAKHVVDKLPHNFENIGLIKFLFPKARIISVRRDPRDIALSNYFTDYQAKHGGMGFAYDLNWIGEQLADHNLLMHHWQQLFAGEILEINYEDVVENTEAMARKMLDYIGVGWEPQVLNFNALERPVKTASVWQVRQPIYKTSQARWRRHQKHLAPLLAGTNAKITWAPIEDMVTLPTPALLTDGVGLYKEDQLDAAETAFKKLLHHLPEHAAANAMVGLIYVRKGHLDEGIALMERGLAKCPWKPEWRKDLIQAYTLAGQADKAAALETRRAPTDVDEARTPDDDALLADRAETAEAVA